MISEATDLLEAGLFVLLPGTQESLQRHGIVQNFPRQVREEETGSREFRRRAESRSRPRSTRGVFPRPSASRWLGVFPEPRRTAGADPRIEHAAEPEVAAAEALPPPA